MHRRVGGDWIDEQVGPGDVSLLTRAVESHWAWPRRIEVVHVYLTQAELAQTCREMYEREVAEVELLDEVKADDPDIHRIAMLLAREAARGGPGSRLLVESLACQLGVYILRKHGHVLFREPDGTGGLSSAQERAVRDYVHEHLQDNLSVGDLAGIVDLSRFQFARRFKQSTGTTPHVYVMDERVARAKTLLRRTGIPLAQVAHQCGFADQSHMNRAFGGRVGTTPGQYREATLGPVSSCDSTVNRHCSSGIDSPTDVPAMVWVGRPPPGFRVISCFGGRLSRAAGGGGLSRFSITVSRLNSLAS